MTGEGTMWGREEGGVWCGCDLCVGRGGLDGG